MEIIRIANGNYEEYERLLLHRDSLEKEARSYYISYTKIFGDLINECFQAEIRCIELKKSIAYVQSCINRRQEYSAAMIEMFIQQQMKIYYDKLRSMASENRICKKAKTIPEEEAKKVKQLYRSLAKKLHPDISPVTAEHEELMDLWNRAMIAYKCNDSEELDEITDLVNIFLSENNIEKVCFSIPDINNKIQKVKDDIQKIISTDPYRFKFLLNDTHQIEERKQNICTQISEYQSYETELKDKLDKLLTGEAG